MTTSRLIRTNINNIDVILASQAHHVPQVGFPHIAPVTKAIILKINPDGAKLFDIKKSFIFKNKNT